MNLKHTHRFLRPLTILTLATTLGVSGTFALGAKPTYAVSYSAEMQKASSIISLGNRYLKTPYQYGAPTNTTKVFDCSSFTKYVFGKNGIYLPRTSKQQATVGTYVPKSQLRKGDLVFFSTRASGKGNIGHVGIYAGDGKILHTYKPGVGVTHSNINSDWWSSHYITARRVIK